MFVHFIGAEVKSHNTIMMSNSLRERLKRSGRSYKSPQNTKRKCDTLASKKVAMDMCVPIQPTSPSHCFPAGHLRPGTTNSKGKNSAEDSISTKLGELNQNTKFKPSSKQIIACCSRLAEEKNVIQLKNMNDNAKLHLEKKLIGKQFEPTEKSGEDGQNPMSFLIDEKAKLNQSIFEKEEQVHKLNMVKMYRSKNDLTELGNLISKWRSISQQSVQELWQLTTESPKPTVAQVIDHFLLQHKLIGFNAEEETFY